MFLKNHLPGVVIVLTAMLNTPCFAQSEITNNQPVAGDLHTREAQIQSKMKANFDAGLIDSDELARLQRDFDGICVQEDDLRSRGSTITDSARQDILKKLDKFEADLDKRTKKGESSKSTD